ncbi:NAD(+)/NADH kinase [Streptomyces sp. NPDC088725]|uniref:NAD(+)/NADH kinase n=1 Tax=Streptomyces sp. NPDC088725 TaxID=3365873 RepID=UPI0038133440
MPVQRIGLVVHQGRPAAVEAARTVFDWCDAHSVPCKELDAWKAHEPRLGSREEAVATGNPDLVVTLGGDGTFLRGARLGAHCDAAVLGVDLGRVGFLTEVPAGKVSRALDAVHEDRATVEERMTLTMRASRPLEIPSGVEALMSYGRAPALPPPHVRPDTDDGKEGWGVALDVIALNDVVLEKLVRDRQVSVGVYLAGRLLASYSADGLVVATPTGSTAYSFAAGGPVLSPHMDAVVFTPVSPHMTFDRSVVAAPDEAVGLRVLPHSGNVAISVDGQLRGVLEPGDWVGVYGAQYRLRMVRMGPTDFYSRLRDRFRLTDAPAAAIDGQAPPLFRPGGTVPDDLAHLRLPPLPPPPPAC